MGFLDKAKSSVNTKEEKHPDIPTFEKEETKSELVEEKEQPLPKSNSSAQSRQAELDSQQANHAVQGIDESSMKKLVEDTTSIDIGDETAQDFLTSLPKGSNIETIPDKILSFIQEQKSTNYVKIASACECSKEDVEKYAKIFSKQGFIQIQYPVFFTIPPTVKFLHVPDVHKKNDDLPEDKKLLEQYTVMADYVLADIMVWSVPRENTPIYQIVPHQFGQGTKYVMFDIIEQLADVAEVSDGEMTDPRKVIELKRKRFDSILVYVKKFFPQVDEQLQKLITGAITHQSFGLGDMEIIMSDNWLEEVAINGDSEPLSVYHKRYGWLKTTYRFDAKNAEVYNLSSQIARKVGKQINALSPIMDAHLQTGDRVAATLFPVSTEGDTLTIRRFSRNPWTVVHMIDPKNHTMSKEIMAFLWQAIQYELNFLVVGGTASGKTSVLNTLSSLIPSTNRIISIEDTREISLPQALHWNWVPMNSKSSNAEGQGQVTMLDLMVASLRMRPDRIIVGEIRRKQQAEAMFEAMHTGHSVCATMHADTAEQIKHRLTQPPIDIPENELQALQLILVQYRDRRRGLRRTLEVAELLPGGSQKIKLNYLYRWRARGDRFVKDEQSIRVVEDLNLHTGMTQREIDGDLKQKESVLDWMLENRIFDVDKVGQIMRIYYKYPQLLLDTIADKGSPSQIVQ